MMRESYLAIGIDGGTSSCGGGITIMPQRRFVMAFAWSRPTPNSTDPRKRSAVRLRITYDRKVIEEVKSSEWDAISRVCSFIRTMVDKRHKDVPKVLITEGTFGDSGIPPAMAHGAFRACLSGLVQICLEEPRATTWRPVVLNINSKTNADEAERICIQRIPMIVRGIDLSGLRLQEEKGAASEGLALTVWFDAVGKWKSISPSPGGLSVIP